jgi:hypothetical protein
VALSCIQDASVLALHVQSRAAVTFTERLPPSWAIVVVGAATVVWHRTPSGPTTVSTAVEPPQVAENAAATRAKSVADSRTTGGAAWRNENG